MNPNTPVASEVGGLENLLLVGVEASLLDLALNSGFASLGAEDDSDKRVSCTLVTPLVAGFGES